MESKLRYDTAQPRFLHYRSHYRIYKLILLALSFLVTSLWVYIFITNSSKQVFEFYSYELVMTFIYFGVAGSFYSFWLRSRLNRSIQVFPTHLLVHHHKEIKEVKFNEIESVTKVYWSVFFFKMKNGDKFYFSAAIERIDYIWEAFKDARPDLVTPSEFEAFRLKLVQYDHHQKRKEWFFRHKLVDIFNWIVYPSLFLLVSYLIQSKEVVIHEQGLYFFRLFMYSALVMLVTTFLFSLGVKKFVFDLKLKFQMEEAPGDKLRNLEFEGIVLRRTKILQMVVASFAFAMILKTDMNLFSIAKVKEDIASFEMKKGSTLIIDNRYNCVDCKYNLKDGDIVMFGKGTMGQILARAGETVGQIGQNASGRFIASEQTELVPEGHVAIRLGNNSDLVIVKLSELIGKVQK